MTALLKLLGKAVRKYIKKKLSRKKNTVSPPTKGRKKSLGVKDVIDNDGYDDDNTDAANDTSDDYSVE